MPLTFFFSLTTRTAPTSQEFGLGVNIWAVVYKTRRPYFKLGTSCFKTNNAFILTIKTTAFISALLAI